jgi:hypothetical protein
MALGGLGRVRHGAAMQGSPCGFDACKKSKRRLGRYGERERGAETCQPMGGLPSRQWLHVLIARGSPVGNLPVLTVD